MKQPSIRKLKNLIIILTLLCVSVFSSYNASAQQFISADQIHSNLTNYPDFSSLCFGLNSTAYLKSNGLTIIGNAPILNLDIDGSALGQINIAGVPSSIKLIRVRVNSPAELNLNALNLQLYNYTNLKYVVVETSFELTSSQINSLQLPAASSNVVCVYSVSIPH